MHNKGFTAVEVLLTVLVVSVLAFGGWYVWNERQEAQSTNTTEEVHRNQNQNQNQNEEATLPENWITITNEGLSVSYPEEWQKYDIAVELKEDGVISFDTGSLITGYKYIRDGNWKTVYTEGTEKPNYKLEPEPITNKVAWADSAVLLSVGDGLCRANIIGLAYKDKVYKIQLPAECDFEAAGGEPRTPTLDSNDGEVEENLETIIKSISRNSQ